MNKHGCYDQIQIFTIKTKDVFKSVPKLKISDAWIGDSNLYPRQYLFQKYKKP